MLNGYENNNNKAHDGKQTKQHHKFYFSLIFPHPTTSHYNVCYAQNISMIMCMIIIEKSTQPTKKHR